MNKIIRVEGAREGNCVKESAGASGFPCYLPSDKPHGAQQPRLLFSPFRSLSPFLLLFPSLSITPLLSPSLFQVVKQHFSENVQSERGEKAGDCCKTGFGFSRWRESIKVRDCNHL